MLLPFTYHRSPRTSPTILSGTPGRRPESQPASCSGAPCTGLLDHQDAPPTPHFFSKPSKSY